MEWFRLKLKVEAKLALSPALVTLSWACALLSTLHLDMSIGARNIHLQVLRGGSLYTVSHKFNAIMKCLLFSRKQHILCV